MQKQTFKTSSLNLASFLLANDMPLVSIFEDKPHLFVFEFKTPEACKRFELAFMNNGEAKAKRLFDARESLIGIMKSQAE